MLETETEAEKHDEESEHFTPPGWRKNSCNYDIVREGLLKIKKLLRSDPGAMFISSCSVAMGTSDELTSGPRS